MELDYLPYTAFKSSKYSFNQKNPCFLPFLP